MAADAQTRVHVGGLTQWGLHSIMGAKTRATGAVPSEGGGGVPPRPGALLVLSGPRGAVTPTTRSTDAPGRCQAGHPRDRHINTQTDRHRPLACRGRHLCSEPEYLTLT